MADYKGIKGFKVAQLASDPTANEGQTWYNTTTSLLKYDGVGAGAWASGNNLNTKRTQLAGGSTGTTTASIVSGGYTSTAPTYMTSNTESWNGTSWTETGNSVIVARYEVGSAGTSTAAVSFGGSPGSPPYSDVTELYNGSAWTASTAMPSPRFGVMAPVGTSSISAMAVSGIYPPTTRLNTVAELSGTTWTISPANVNTARHSGGGAGSVTSALICGGNTPPKTDKAESWNGSTWTEIAVLNTPRHYNSCAGTSNTSAMTFGGETPSVTNKTEIWNGSAWTEVGNMVTATASQSGNGTTAAALEVGSPNATGGLTTQVWDGVPLTVKTVTTS